MKKYTFILVFLLLFSLLASCSNNCKHEVVIEDSAVDATCNEFGLTAGSHCEKCGKVLVAQEVIEPLKHNIVIDEAVPVTCEEDGKTAGAHCSLCGLVIVEQEIILHSGHSVVEDLAKEATISETGLTEGFHCYKCGEVFLAQEVIDKLTSYTLSAISNNLSYGYVYGETEQLLLENQESTTLTAIPYLGYRFKCWSNGSTEDTITVTLTSDLKLVANFEIADLELPVVEIHTENSEPIVSKDVYLKCGVTVSNAEFKYEFANVTGKIKGRGNSTWGMPKKPYKLKFDEKIDLFGNGSAKTWTLIVNYCDKTLLRNYIAFSIGELVESDYVTSTQFVDLYVNGEYLGVYLVCEQNEVGKTRVNIDESYKNVNTGYLLEMDGRAPEEGEENKDWFYFNGVPYAIKSPETDNEKFNEDFVNYIKTYLNDSFNAILSKDYDEVKKYIDVDSFAKSYIVHEVMNCLDVGGLSFYIFKDKDGKLKSGPIWDFDISSGNYDYAISDPTNSYNRLWAREANTWYNNLLEIAEFGELVGSYLQEKYDDINNLLQTIYDQTDSFKNSFERNFQKWQIMGVYVWPNSPDLVPIDTWKGQVDWLMNWLHNSLDYVYNFYVN